MKGLACLISPTTLVRLEGFYRRKGNQIELGTISDDKVQHLSALAAIRVYISREAVISVYFTFLCASLDLRSSSSSYSIAYF